MFGRQGLRIRAVIVSTGVVAALLCFEVALRITGVGHLRQWVPDYDRGRALIPDQAGWFCQEGCAYIRNNSAGFRDDERSLQKPPLTVRIALLGDSFVQAKQVSKDERFGELLEQRLNDQRCFGDKNAEVLNFGVAGYGTAEELLTFRHVVRSYAPDIVLLAFSVGSDLINNTRSLERKANIPYFELKDGELVLDTTFRDAKYAMTWHRRLAYRAIESSRVLQVAYRARERLQSKGMRAERARVAASVGLNDIGINQIVFLEPKVVEWRETWAATEAILRQMHKEVEAEGARFMVVTVTMGPQVHPDTAVRQRLQDRLGVTNLFYPDDRIKKLGDAEGFPVLTLAQPFQKLAETNGSYLHGFPNTQLGAGHWNTAGHRLAGELIGAEISRLTQTAWWQGNRDAAAVQRGELESVR